MPSAGGYTPIPDVETGEILKEVDVDDESIMLERAMKRYPDANEVEAAFFGKLDEAIENARPEIVLPKVQASDIGPPKSIMQFVGESLVLPTYALGAALVSAAVVVVTGSPVAKALFPYYACILMFPSSIPATRTRFMGQVTPAFTILDDTKALVEEKVSGVSTKALEILDQTEKAMYTAIAPIKSKADMATKAETMLRLVKPDIDIPDTSDIEKSFNRFEAIIRGAFGKKVTPAMDISRTIPKVFQSLDFFEYFAFYPFLAVFLLLQLFSVFTATSTSSSESMITTSETAMIRTEFVAARALNADSDFDSTLSSDVISSVDVASMANATLHDGTPNGINEWGILWFAIQAYAATAVQLALAFVITQANAIAAVINHFLKRVESTINTSLDDQVGNVFRKIFQEGFGESRNKCWSSFTKWS
jgi:hypothetical protein